MSADHEATITKLKQRVEDEEAQENGDGEAELIEDADFEALEEIEVAKSSVRDYVVLVNTGQTWKELGRSAASTSTGAIHSLLGEKLEANVEYVGIPVRSWKPASFEVETKTTFKLTSK